MSKTFEGIPISAFPIWVFSKDTCFKCGKKATYYLQMGKDFICFYKMPTKQPKPKKEELVGSLCTKDYVDMAKKVEGNQNKSNVVYKKKYKVD